MAALTLNPLRARVASAGPLALVQAPRLQSEGTGDALPVGIVLGLVLGLVLAIALERADPRIDSVEALADTVGIEASSIDNLSPAAAAALLERWTVLTDRPKPIVTLLAAVPRIEGAMPVVTRRLSALARQSDEMRGGPDHTDAPNRAGYEGVKLVAGGVPGGKGAGERVAAAADGVVLVVPRGPAVPRSPPPPRRFGS